jgi:2-methylcitrate dehydratase PrpD
VGALRQAHEPRSQHRGQIADRVTRLRDGDLPAEVVDRTILIILDQLGQQLLGSSVAPAAGPVDRQATLTHSGCRTTVSHAAWVNGTLGHVCEYEDPLAADWLTAAAVVPAALAIAERDHASGREVVTAVAAGIQAMAWLGLAMAGATAAHRARIVAVAGATAACGRLLRLTAEQLSQAFVTAMSALDNEPGWLDAGWAARTGLEAAQFGSPEGDRPLWFAANCSVSDVAWDRWHVLDMPFRLQPVASAVHAPLDALRRLRTDHPMRADEVAKIRVALGEQVMAHGASLAGPTDALSARFSLAFSVGLQLVTGGNTPADYWAPPLWSDPRILAVGQLVEIDRLSIPDGDPPLSARVDVELRDGTVLSHYQPGFRGHPSRPATYGEVAEKFRHNATAAVSADRATALLRAVAALDSCDDFRTVASLLWRPD